MPGEQSAQINQSVGQDIQRESHQASSGSNRQANAPSFDEEDETLDWDTLSQQEKQSEQLADATADKNEQQSSSSEENVSNPSVTSLKAIRRRSRGTELLLHRITLSNGLDDIPEIQSPTEAVTASKRNSYASSPAISRRSSVRQARQSVQEAAAADDAAQRRNLRRRSLRSTIVSHRRQESEGQASCMLTDLELWTALVSDYRTTAQRLPTLTTRKIRQGIPDPLRGLVWQAIVSARDTNLEGLFEQLTREKNPPFERVIERDLARTFPQVEMFRKEGGEGQMDLGRVLRAYSIYDAELGYCQGLGFIVAPLLLNMSDCEAFCCLVRIMEHHGVRAMFLPTLEGLKLRLYQFEKLLVEHAPDLAAHLESIDVRPALYASQWFLSLFGVTCPLTTLHRMYDIILAEGASETIMRVALALLIRNKDFLLAADMESAMRLLLGSELWTAYEGNDDILVADAVTFTPYVTTEVLGELERDYVPEDYNQHARSYSSVSASARPTSTSSQSHVTRGLSAIATGLLTRINPSRIFSGGHSQAPSLAESITLSPANGRKRASARRSMLGTTVTTSDSTSVRTSGLELVTDDNSSQTSAGTHASPNADSVLASLKEDNDVMREQMGQLVEALSQAHTDAHDANERATEAEQKLNDFKLLVRELFIALAMPHESEAAEPPAPIAQTPVPVPEVTVTEPDDFDAEAGLGPLVTHEAVSPFTPAAEFSGTSGAHQGPSRQACINRWCLELQTQLDSFPPCKEDADVYDALRSAEADLAKLKSEREAVLAQLHRGQLPSFNAPPNADTSDEDDLHNLRLELSKTKASLALALGEAEEARFLLSKQRRPSAVDGMPTPKSVPRATLLERSESAPARPADNDETAAAGLSLDTNVLHASGAKTSDSDTAATQSAPVTGWFSSWTRRS
ncbi:hypothetical protein PYCC9005_002076 [Savitreella phatthalungensis]